jgi:NAD(P)H-dependent FMN reductase
MVTIKIIIGSTRPNRFGPQIGHFFMELANKRTDATFELIDLEQINLPFLDEPKQPSEGNYVQEHTKAWAKVIDAADGFIWAHPEYNHGINPALKNAIDFLWAEWHHKPVALAGYGGEAGGARAAEQLRMVAVACKMFPLRSALTLAGYRQFVNDAGEFVPTDLHIKIANGMLDEVVFWSEQFKRARAELAAQK